MSDLQMVNDVFNALESPTSASEKVAAVRRIVNADLTAEGDAECLGSKRAVGPSPAYVETCVFCGRRIQVLRGKLVAHADRAWWRAQ